jgi:hypothetical protein
MKIKSKFRQSGILFILGLLSFLSIGCSGFMNESDSEYSSNNIVHIEPTTVANTTHRISPVLNANTFTLEEKLSGISAQADHGTDAIILTSAENAGFASASDVKIKAGDILTGNVSSQTPHGFLKKVSGVRHENGKIHIDVTQIPLEEAIKDANFTFDHPLKKQDFVSFAPAVEGVKLNDINGVTDEITIKVDVIIYDKDGNMKTTYDQAKITGTYTLDLSLNGDIQIENFNLTKLKLYSRVKSDLKWTIGWGVSLKSVLPEDLAKKLDKKIPLGSFVIAPLTIMVGPVPVVIVTKINLLLTCGGNLSLNASLGSDQSLSFAMGFQFLNGKLSPYTEGPVLNLKFSEALGLKASLEAGIGPELEASIYGLAGPTIGAQVYLNAEVGIKQTNLVISSAAELKLGIKGTVGGQIDALTKFIGKLQLTIFDLVLWKLPIPIISNPEAPNYYPVGIFDGIRRPE